MKNDKLEAKNGLLLESLTSKLLPVPEKPFVEEEGFYDCETLKKMSHEAGDSDYSFVKFLMLRFWPEGFAGRSVTGRSSNNPSGRPKKPKGDQTTSQAENESSQDTCEATGSQTKRRIERVPLEEARVQYIASMFFAIKHIVFLLTLPFFNYQIASMTDAYFYVMMQQRQKPSPNLEHV